MAFSQDRVQQRRLRRLPTFLLPVEVFKVFSQKSILQHGLWSRMLIFQFRVVVAEVVEVFKIFAHNRVQQRRLRRSLTFLQVEGLTVFSPVRVTQRLPLRLLNFRLVEVFTVHAQDRIPRRFLDLNTAIPRSSSSSPVRWPTLHPAWTRRLRLHRVQCGGRVPPSSLWWVSRACLVAGALRRRRVRNVLCPDGSRRLHGGLRHRGGGSGVRGFASPHPILGAISWARGGGRICR